MNELDRYMLRIGCAGAAPESQQAASALKAFGHFVRNRGQARSFPGEEFLEYSIAREEPLSDLMRKSGGCAQHMRGSGSPTSISITRVPPYEATARTVAAGDSRTSPITRASSPPGVRCNAWSALSANSGDTTATNWPSFA